MTRNTLILILVGGWMTLLSPSLAYATAYALLIGIQDYSEVQDTNSPKGSRQVQVTTTDYSLNGPRHDIALISKTLQEVLLIPKDNIAELLDKEATHTGIENAFKALSKKVQKNDFVYIHYSGHGSLTLDGNGDEKSGKDQTWVSYGARTGLRTGLNGIDDYDILDDEIDDWLQPIFNKTERVVVVLDSCHSGTATKGATIRKIPQDTRTHPLANKSYRSAWANIQGIRIGATKDDINAYEKSFHGKHYGIFTWFWADALEKHRQSDWITIFSIVYQRTRDKAYQQQPHLDHPRSDDSLLYEGILYYIDLPRGLFPILVTSDPFRKQGKRVVNLAAGASSGLTKGSRYWLFGNQNRKPRPILELTKVWAYKSEGRIIQGPFQKGDLVIEKQRAYDTSLPVMIGLQDAGAYKAVAETVSQLSGYTLTSNPNQAVLKIHISATHLQVTDNNDQLIHPFLRIPLANQKKALDLLRYNLAIYARAHFVKTLRSPEILEENAPQLRFRLLKLDRKNHCETIKEPSTYEQLEKILLQEGNNSPCVKFPDELTFQLWPYFTDQVTTAQPGDKVALLLDNNQGVRHYYYYLVMVEPNGRVNTVELGKVKQKSRVIADQLMLSLSSNEVWKLITTTEEINIANYRQNGFQETVPESQSSEPPSKTKGGRWYVRTYDVHVSDR